MSELIEDIRKPISETAPCGEDVRYDDDYMALQAEINKTADNDWEMVVDFGHTILAQKSKDLNVATWLCIGLLQLQGFDGLADGLEGYQFLIKEYWDGLYPTSPRARVNAFGMLSRRLGGDASTMGLVEARQATSNDANALRRVREAVKILNTEIQDKFPGGALSLNNVADAIEDKLKTIGPPPASSADVSQPVVEHPHVPVSTTPSVQEKQEIIPSEVSSKASPAIVQQQVAEPKSTVDKTTPAGKTIQETSPIKEAPPAVLQPVTTQQRVIERPQTPAEETVPATSAWKTRAEAIDIIIQAVAFLRSQNPRDVIPYRLLRSVRWDSWQELPSDWRDNKAPFPLPQSERRANLDTLVKSENWEALLKQSEELFAEGNCYFWLDLQRYVDTALKGLGAGYDAVRKAILRETAGLVDRLPKVTELSYRDGTEFADEETKDWLEKEVRPTLSLKGAVVKDTGEAETQVGVSKEQKVSQSEVTTSQSGEALVSSAAQQIDVVGDGAKVEITIKIYTK